MYAFAAAVLSAAVLAGPPAATPEPLFPVVKDGKWGYVDRAGRVVVPPRFDEAARFSEGLAPVRLGAQLGYADATGAVALVPRFEPAAGTLHRRFAGGRAMVKKDGRYGFIDAGGRLAVPARWLTAEDFSEGRALVCDEQGCGFVDGEGRFALVTDAMAGTPLRNGIASIVLAMGMSHRRTAFWSVDRGLLPGQYEGSGSYSEGLAPVRFAGRWGYVDVEGKPVVSNQFEDAGDFSEGRAAVTDPLSGRCGYIDRTGAFVIPPRFASCRPFADGLARVDLAEGAVDAERVGFVDGTGKLRIRGDAGDASRPAFRSASDFSDGLAAIADGPIDLAGEGQVRLGYLDTSGRLVWPLQR